MITVKLKCDKKIRDKFKTYGISKHKLENFLNFLTNNLKKTYKWQYYEIDVKGIDSTCSQYFWDDNQIQVALKCNDCNTKKQRRIYFITSLVHEYRHWVQCKIEKVPSSKLTYSESDINEHTSAYTDNKYELECKQWEQLAERFNDFI